MPSKLDYGQKHFLVLIDKDKDEDGWTKVSDVVMPLIKKMPPELVEVEPGRCRMTTEGESVFSAMTKWL